MSMYAPTQPGPTAPVPPDENQMNANSPRTLHPAPRAPRAPRTPGSAPRASHPHNAQREASSTFRLTIVAPSNVSVWITELPWRWLVMRPASRRAVVWWVAVAGVTPAR